MKLSLLSCYSKCLLETLVFEAFHYFEFFGSSYGRELCGKLKYFDYAFGEF